jgi:hypothetical protein
MLLIIPHADKFYAGKARQRAFSRAKNVQFTNIVYIASNHRGLFLPILKFQRGQTPSELDHSFLWVADELYEAFPSVLHYTTITPNRKTNIKELAKQLFDEYDKKRTLFIATADFMHFGPAYGEPGPDGDYALFPQLYKMKKEEPLIEALLQKKELEDLLLTNASLTCSPYALQTAMHLARKFPAWNATLCDYYDSEQLTRSINTHDELDLYAWNYKSNPTTFVSYASISYSPENKGNVASRLRKQLFLGLTKAIVGYSLYHINKINFTLAFLPSWAHQNIPNGVFVGTFVSKHTNCSYGSYEQQKEEDLGEKIARAASHCLRDSLDRWQRPLTVENLDQVKFKVEILQKKPWVRKNGLLEIANYYTTHRDLGIFLCVSDHHCATFLPIVWAEHKDWSVEKLLLELRFKAGVTEWPKTGIYAEFYSTTVLCS